MKTNLPKEKSIIEQDNDLWIASRRYMRGEITWEELKSVQRPYIMQFEKAMLGLSRQGYVEMYKHLFSRMKLVIIILCLIVISLILLILTKNTFPLILPLVPLVIRFLK
jgi:hypothetical protein